MKLLDEIVLWPDERLTDTCEEISEITDEIRDIAKCMLQDMYATDGGSGGTANRRFEACGCD